MTDVGDLLWVSFCVALFAPLLLCMVYVTSRVAAIAYFRTKLEHLKTVLHETGKGEKTDGKGPV